MAAVNVVDCRQPRPWALAAFGLALRRWPPCSALAGAVAYAGMYAQPSPAVMYASIAAGYLTWAAERCRR